MTGSPSSFTLDVISVRMGVAHIGESETVHPRPLVTGL